MTGNILLHLLRIPFNSHLNHLTHTGKENLTLKLVFNDFLFSEIYKSEREYAGEFLEENLNGFKVYEKNMKITNNRKLNTLIAGRNYYSLYSSDDDHDKVIPSTYANNLFLIYFPDDFRMSSTFYQFLIMS